ncbi:MAG: hypothetical protein IPJ61_02150 [Tessaracoccus sp.]|uniref:ATP-binding protein n=1 Tax=Tessaracoccus sp. TaxID=1971211 RepID=UPI001ED4C140|nr:SbcC/MukB-like Walker B domain-containing protein [Tessaracoccus sp.]MBK7819893.1 hypothetical protein [Tessaracoccus sp.]
MNQHRLARVQLINWGTFEGAWAFDVPWKGMLLTGPSGAGKSSVLDAMAAILVAPAKVRFNAAAQGTDTRDHDRSLVTYVRGAHKREADEETGEVGAAFLRKGPTWSGIALTFVDEARREITLLRLFHISGSSTNRDDLRSLYAIAPGRPDLLEVKDFVANGLEYRRMKNAYPGWHLYRHEGYSAFSERFRKLLGIGSEQAQVLLHKTQSAKNLTNLDALFRDFMLDVPETFALAETTIAQFGELRSAHASVVDARRQVEALAPLRALDSELRLLEDQRREVREQLTHLGTWVTTRRREELRTEADLAGPLRDRLVAEVDAAGGEARDAEAERRRSQQAVDGSGGGDIQTLEELLDVHVANRDAAAKARDRLQLAADAIGAALPVSPEDVAGFGERIAEAQAELAARAARFGRAQGELLQRKGRLADAHRRLADELDAVRRHRSNLDARLLGVRENLAQLLQVPVSTLPFVGELLQVRAEEAGWTGAIERVLGGFGRTLVVPARHYLAAAEFIDGEYLGARLVYERVEPEERAAPPVAAEGLLPGKVELADGPYTGWLAERLHRRYGYACVANVGEFAAHDRAVTRNGQVKHSTQLHEKDDRRRVDDRSRWVLGFSTEAKEAELERLLAVSREELEGIEARLRTLDAEDAERRDRERALRALEGFAWEQVDLAAHDARIAAVETQLGQLRDTHRDLRALEVALRRAVERKAKADDALEKLRVALLRQEDRLTTLAREIGAVERQLADAEPVPDPVREALDDRAASLAATATELDGRLREQLHGADTGLSEAIGKADRKATQRMEHYRDTWRAAAADWDSSREFLPEFLDRLDDLEGDRLPEFEDRFFDLLDRQARNNISTLAQQIRNAHREIRSRVDEVNRSLLMTPFGREGRLQIKVLHRSLPDVDTFLRTLNQITEGSMLDVGGAEDRRQAEERFGRMEALLDRLGSADSADRSWRDRCLDTRQHVQFQARVIDDDGVQVDVYTGSGGRSGGERQKLVTFCLAAALRFQLAPEGQAAPTYALVVIDEAFDKADHTFTQAGLEVFRTFGFQLLLATPMKMLQTIDDYVGGVVMVTNQPGRGSMLQQLHYDVEAPSVGKEPEQGVLL